MSNKGAEDLAIQYAKIARVSVLFTKRMYLPALQSMSDGKR